MHAFRLTRKARTDLKMIAAYTQRKWGIAQRRVYIKQLDDIFHLLAENSGTGTACDYIKKSYRKYPGGSHIVFYRVVDNNLIEIVRILHKCMDAVAQLESP